ncbi:MAG: lipocalin-like domain-containing protein, partial [Candidatus Parabeggiatoa sp.]|nr:lipocalin-like domain-containing protein [Candidatus Parabeggiatoa sp.]
MVKEKFIGVWKLISVETIYSNGDIVPTFKEPKGILIYESNNIVVAQVSGEYTDEALEKSPMKVTKEAKKKIPTFRAYWGKYEINEKECLVLHHILGGSEEISSFLAIV